MANPILGAAKKNKILSQFSQKYVNQTYINELLLPPLRVKEKTGNYAKYDKSNLRTYAEIFRAPGTRALSVDYGVSQGSYVCRERALEKLVPDEFINNTDDPYDPKRDAVATLMDNIWVNQENALATDLADTNVLTNNTTLSGTDQWSDYLNSDPFDDIRTGIDTIRVATSQLPNTAWMSYEVMNKLKQHPDVREQVKYTNGGQLSNDAFINFMKGFFNLDNVYIGTAIKNTADEGQTDSLSSVWGKHFWLAYISPRPTLMRATFGYTFTDVPREVDTYREESKKSEVVRVRYSYDQNLMDVNLAYLIKDAIA